MVGEWVELLRRLGADLGGGLEMESGAGPAAESLPAVHADLLRSLNGLTVYHGRSGCSVSAGLSPLLTLLPGMPRRLGALPGMTGWIRT